MWGYQHTQRELHAWEELLDVAEEVLTTAARREHLTDEEVGEVFLLWVGQHETKLEAAARLRPKIIALCDALCGKRDVHETFASHCVSKVVVDAERPPLQSALENESEQRDFLRQKHIGLALEPMVWARIKGVQLKRERKRIPTAADIDKAVAAKQQQQQQTRKSAPPPADSSATAGKTSKQKPSGSNNPKKQQLVLDDDPDDGGNTAAAAVALLSGKGKKQPQQPRSKQEQHKGGGSSLLHADSGSSSKATAVAQDDDASDDSSDNDHVRFPFKLLNKQVSNALRGGLVSSGIARAVYNKTPTKFAASFNPVVLSLPNGSDQIVSGDYVLFATSSSILRRGSTLSLVDRCLCFHSNEKDVNPRVSDDGLVLQVCDAQVFEELLRWLKNTGELVTPHSVGEKIRELKPPQCAAAEAHGAQQQQQVERQQAERQQVERQQVEQADELCADSTNQQERDNHAEEQQQEQQHQQLNPQFSYHQDLQDHAEDVEQQHQQQQQQEQQQQQHPQQRSFVTPTFLCNE